jgi:uncharacterized tellurite resistance protein B-like protein
MDFTTFFDIYMRPHSRRPLDRDGIEFRYAAAALLIACSKSDLDEHPEERQVITEILEETFSISKKTVDRLLAFADTASEGTYLTEITTLVNEQFNDRDKRFLLEKLWCVAYADGRIETREREFIDRIASQISLSSEDVETAHTLAQHQLN